MKEFRKITRVSVFIDYDNFFISYLDKFHPGTSKEKRDKLMWDEIGSMPVWDNLNDNLINYYAENFIKNDFEILEHTGTFLCVGVSEMYNKVESKRKEQFKEIDRKHGFIVKYGHRTKGYWKGDKFQVGKEKGVDAEIICTMLMGAFLDHYDSCILMSDDGDYVPVIERVQDYFGKKVIQAGFKDVPSRNKAYAHIPFERADKTLGDYLKESVTSTS